MSERNAPSHPPTREVPLCNSEMVAIIDASDWPMVQGYTWHAYPVGDATVARAWLIPEEYDLQPPPITMHHHILGKGRRDIVHHHSDNWLDNRRQNLVALSQEEAAASRGPNANNKLGIKNIRLHRGKYRLERSTDGEKYALSFDDIEEATITRDKLALDLDGWERAYTEYPKENYREYWIHEKGSTASRARVRQGSAKGETPARKGYGCKSRRTESD